MLLTLQAFVVLGVGQPTVPQPALAECPTGVFVRSGQPCPPIGPHPTYLFFDLDRAALSERSRRSLDFLAQDVRRNPKWAGWAYVIEGHADRSGPEPYNQDLSRRRAEAVRAHLVRGGLPAHAIAVTYFGEQRPLKDTEDGAAEPDNRRVVITIVRPE